MAQRRKHPVILWLFLSSFLWQINRAPSFGTDQKIDYDVKKGVLLNALKLLNIRYSSTIMQALTCIIVSRGLTCTESQSLYQNLVLRSSVNTSNTRSLMHCQCSCLDLLWLKCGCYAPSSSPFCHIATDLKLIFYSFITDELKKPQWKAACFQGTNSMMLMLEWKRRFVAPLLLL